MPESERFGGFEPPSDPAPLPPGVFNFGFHDLDAFPTGACQDEAPRNILFNTSRVPRPVGIERNGVTTLRCSASIHIP